ncbi:MAG: Fic family protein [Pyrinomonadaceae bacterium]
MRKGEKRAELEALVLQLLNDADEVSIRSIAEAAGVPNDETERKAIRRALASLTRQNLVDPKGSARARVYVLHEQKPKAEVPREKEQRIGAPAPTIGNVLKGIDISPESIDLWDYVTQALAERAPVGYLQEFLRSYEPNETFYLDTEHRDKLKALGQVEAVVRPAGTYARNILDRLLIDLSWNSSRLEGNTYSLLETKRLIELGETATGKEVSEAQMILNHKAAIEYIVESAEDDEITSHEICSIHALLSENLLGDPAASGRLRSIIVEIGGSTYVPLENPQLILEYFDIFIKKINQIEDPFERSLFSIVHLSYLQAFEDVNKRTARLVANIPLVKKNLRPLSFTDVDKDAYVYALLGIYERNDISLIRDLYIWAYNRSSQRYTAIQQAMGEPNFLKLRYRAQIQEIVRSIILDCVGGSDVVPQIHASIDSSTIAEADREEVFSLIEHEIVSLHDGNVARFKVRPSEFQAWKKLQ